MILPGTPGPTHFSFPAFRKRYSVCRNLPLRHCFSFLFGTASSRPWSAAPLPGSTWASCCTSFSVLVTSLPSNITKGKPALGSFLCHLRVASDKRKALKTRSAGGRVVPLCGAPRVFTSGLCRLHEILEVAEDMEIDIPHVWLYLAELVTPILREGGVPMGEFFR